MAIIKSIPSIFFDEHSKSVESPVFVVDPGDVVQLMAFNFVCQRTKVDEGERSVPLVAKLQQIIFKETLDRAAKKKSTTSCGSDFIVNNAEITAVDDVQICGNCVMLSASNNILLINVPGAYRLVLNDTTALGTARVFGKKYTYNEYIWNSQLFMGERL